jgi:uncharacterized protein (DUF2236 family)
VGRVLGIRDGHLPPDLKAFRAYVRDMVTRTLADNDTAREVLGSLRLDRIGPPWPLFPEPLWRAVRPLGRNVLHDATVGTLPSALRHTLGLRWSAVDQRRLQATAILVRAASMPLPDRVAQYPLGARARREARGSLRLAS